MAYSPIDNSGKHFKVVAYTGDGSEPRNIDVGFQADLIWVKDRTVLYHHRLFDSSRTVSNIGKALYVNNSAAQDNYNDHPEVDFGSPYTNGWAMVDNQTSGGSTGSVGVNNLNSLHDNFNWKLGGGPVSNTDGNITSTVNANPLSGCSSVTYTGTGVQTGKTVGHGLGAIPEFIISKDIGATSNVATWRVYHKSIGATKYLTLSTEEAPGTYNDWDNTAPTSSVYSIGGAGGYTPTNTTNASYVGYVFAPVKGFSKFDEYTGNGSTSGPYINCGFKPAWVMVKNKAAGVSWMIQSSPRDIDNPVHHRMKANDHLGVSDNVNQMDFYSNGFKLTINDSSWNTNGNVYVYAAFAEHPFVSGNAPTTAR